MSSKKTSAQRTAKTTTTRVIIHSGEELAAGIWHSTSTWPLKGGRRTMRLEADGGDVFWRLGPVPGFMFCLRGASSHIVAVVTHDAV